MYPQSRSRRKPLHLERLFDRLAAPRPAYKASREARPGEEAGQAMALLRAAERGDGPQVQKLLDQGADPKIMSNGRLALNECLLRGHHALARTLVAHGADPRAMDRNGRTAMGLAWQGSRGGQALDTTIDAASCGEDHALLVQWEAHFGRRGNHELFSAAHQDGHMGLPMGLRLDLDGHLPGGLGHEGRAGGGLAIEDISSPRTLVARQRERAARLAPELPERHAHAPSTLNPRTLG